MDAEFKIISAIELIEKHIQEPLAAKDIANETGLSLRHLHRLFQYYCGDTLQNYARMRRLTSASKDIINTKKSILDIALSYQFQSGEAFSRAFKQGFWLSPKIFREIGSPYNALQRHKISQQHFEIIKQGYQHSPDIVDLPIRYMVGKKVIQPHYAFRVENNISEGNRVAQLLANSQSHIENINDGSEWNIAFRRKNLYCLHKVEHYYCVEVKKPGKYPDNLSALELPRQRYAVFRHYGADILVEFTISLAFAWLKKNTYYLGDAPSMFHLQPGQRFTGDLYIPISSQRQTHHKWWQGYSKTINKIHK